MILHPEVIETVENRLAGFRDQLEQAHQKVAHLPDDMTMATVGDVVSSAMHLYGAVAMMWEMMKLESEQ